MTFQRVVIVLIAGLVILLSACGNGEDANGKAEESAAPSAKVSESAIIIGIHGLGAKPEESVLARSWSKAIDSGLGLHGHSDIASKKVGFELVRWAAEVTSGPPAAFGLIAQEPIGRRRRMVQELGRG